MEGIEKITARIIEDAEREIAQMQRENEEKCPFPAAELAEETLEDAYLYQTQDINRIRSRRDENAVV